MSITKVGTVEICVDCYFTTHNGWDEDWQGPLPTPEPLGLLAANEILGEPEEDEGEDLRNERSWHFSNRPCPTCGTRLAGDRWEMDVYSI